MIEVRYNEFYNMEEVVPVTVLEDKKIVWCNHAITNEEYAEFTTGQASGFEEHTVNEAIEVCRKCQSWRFVGEEWRGAYE